jgi:hypothetical protein
MKKEIIFYTMLVCMQSMWGASSYTPLAGDLTILPSSMEAMLPPSHMYPKDDAQYTSGPMHLTRQYHDKLLEYRNNHQKFGVRRFQFRLEHDAQHESVEFPQVNLSTVRCTVFGTDRAGLPREWSFELSVGRNMQKHISIDSAIKIEKIVVHPDGFVPVSFTSQEQPLFNEPGSFVIGIAQSTHQYGMPFVFVTVHGVQSFKQILSNNSYMEHKVSFAHTIGRERSDVDGMGA